MKKLLTKLFFLPLMLCVFACLKNKNNENNRSKTEEVRQKPIKKLMGVTEDPLLYFEGNYILLDKGNSGDKSEIKIKFLTEENRINISNFGSFQYSIEVKGENIVICLNGTSTKDGEIYLNPFGETRFYRRSGENKENLKIYERRK